MQTQRNISVAGVLTEGFKVGVANIASLIVASILYVLTCWIPYLNVGTTIAMSTIPLKLSQGKVVSPMFIFDGEYRQYMGEYFTLQGLMMMSLTPAFLFLIVPGIIISISWSLALYIMLDRKIAPGEALIESNKATYGHKGAIFGINFLLFILCIIIFSVLSIIPVIGSLAAIVICIPFVLGCQAIIYKNLAKEFPAIEAITKA
ncbi:MAG: hypothetical protein II999_04000 [Bacteroidaceae bacterium]|nr:hypothetical protein [Bacteroidaceae bacterium]